MRALRSARIRVRPGRSAAGLAQCAEPPVADCREIDGRARRHRPRSQLRTRRQRGLERAAGQAVDRRLGGGPGSAASRSARAGPVRPATRSSRPHVYGCCGSQKTARRRCRHSTARAGVHDEDVVGELGDDAEVVGDQDDRRSRTRAAAAAISVEDLRLDGDVERGRSARRRSAARGPAQRHRDHRPLAHPAGELVRVVVGRADLAAGCRPGRAARRRAAPARLCGWSCGRGAGSARRSASRPGSRDAALDSGSWKIHADLRAADVPQ